MARAKRTERAEARRRHRAALVQAAPDAEGAPDGGDSGPDAPGAARASEAGGGDRPRGIRYAFGASFRPFDLRGDLAALPLLVRSRALLVPLVLLGLTTVAWVIAESGLPPIGSTTDAPASPVVLVAYFAFQYFVMTPPIGGAFIGGFIASRGSWLIGAMIGLVAAVVIAILATVAPSAIDRLVGTTDATRTAYVAQGLLVSPVACAVFAAAAAWYKRFLDLANPNRRRAQAQKASRSSGRSSARPLLSRANARRR